MTINVSSLGGGGGLLKTELVTGGFVATGTTLDVTVSCPVGKYIRLSYLVSIGDQSGVSLAVGTNTVFSSFTVKGVTALTNITNQIKIGSYGGATDPESVKYIQGGKDEDFVFSLDASTTSAIAYGYEVLSDA